MPIPLPTTIATGLADGVGSDYHIATDQRYRADLRTDLRTQTKPQN